MFGENRHQQERAARVKDEVQSLQERFMKEQVEGKREPRQPEGPLWQMYRAAAEAEGISEKDARDVLALSLDFAWSGFAKYSEEGAGKVAFGTHVNLPKPKNDFAVRDQEFFSFHGRVYVLRKKKEVDILEKGDGVYRGDVVHEKSAQWLLGVLDPAVDYWKADDKVFKEELDKDPSFHLLTSIPTPVFGEGPGSTWNENYADKTKHLVNRAWQFQYLLGAWTGKTFAQEEFDAFVDKVSIALGPGRHGYIPFHDLQQFYNENPRNVEQNERGMQALQLVLMLRMLDAARPGAVAIDYKKAGDMNDPGFRQALVQYKDLPGFRMWAARFTGQSHEAGHAREKASPYSLNFGMEEKEGRVPAPEVDVVTRGPVESVPATLEERVMWRKVVDAARRRCTGLRAVALELLEEPDMLDRNPDNALRRQALIAGVIERDASNAEDNDVTEAPMVRMALEDGSLWYPSAAPRIEAALALGAQRVVIVAPSDKATAALARVMSTLEKIIPDFAALRKPVPALPNGISFEADFGTGAKTVKIAVVPAQFGRAEKDGGIPQKFFDIAPPGLVLGLGALAPGRSGAELDADQRLFDALTPGGVVLSDAGVRSARKHGNDPATGQRRQQLRGELQSYRTLRPYGINTKGAGAKDDVTFVMKSGGYDLSTNTRKRAPFTWEPPRDLVAHQSLTLPSGMKAVFEVRYDSMVYAQEADRGGILGAFPEGAKSKGVPHLRIIHEPTVKWSNTEGRYQVRTELGGQTTVVRTSMRVKGFDALMRAIRGGNAGDATHDGDPNVIFIEGQAAGTHRHPLSLHDQLRLIGRCMTYDRPESEALPVAPVSAPKVATLSDLAAKFGSPSGKKKK